MKKATHIYFVRHAEPNYTQHDDLTRELSPKGLRDRELVTAFLSGKGVEAVLSSPCKRAIDTVGHFATAHGLSIASVYDFRERRVGDEWIDHFDSFVRRQWADFDYKLSHGESLADVQKRNIAALQTVLTSYEGKTIAIGSHGTALSTIIHFYQPQFDMEEFMRIKGIMPWIVHFVFSGKHCEHIEEFDLFSGASQSWL